MKITPKMKVVRLKTPGSAKNLQLSEEDRLAPNPGEFPNWSSFRICR
jgi:hypothetical protein